MDIDQLRTFLAVVEHASFSRAAEALHVGQSTVSFHIKALETSVGSRLLDRGRGRVRPTAAGGLLRRYAERIVALREEAIVHLRDEERGTAGHITIAASTVPAEYVLPPLLAAFRRHHPGVGVTVTVSDSGGAGAAVLGEQCDLAVTGKRIRDRRVVSSALAEDEVVLVGPCPNPFAPSGRLTLDELRAQPLVLREEGSGTRDAVLSILARVAAIAAPDATVSRAFVQVGSPEAAKRCVREGLGLTFISRLAVAEELASGRLSLVELPDTPVRRRFWLARPSASSPTAATRAFIRLCVQKSR